MMHVVDYKHGDLWVFMSTSTSPTVSTELCVHGQSDAGWAGGHV